MRTVVRGSHVLGLKFWARHTDNFWICTADPLIPCLLTQRDGLMWSSSQDMAINGCSGFSYHRRFSKQQRALDQSQSQFPDGFVVYPGIYRKLSQIILPLFLSLSMRRFDSPRACAFGYPFFSILKFLAHALDCSKHWHVLY